MMANNSSDKLSDDSQEGMDNIKQSDEIFSRNNVLIDSLNSSCTLRSCNGGVVTNLTNAGIEAVKMEKPQQIRSAVSKKR